MTIALLALSTGVALIGLSALLHRSSRQHEMDELLGLLPFPLEEGKDGAAVSALASRATDLATQMVDKVDQKRSLSSSLERASIPLRPGEFVVVTVAGGLALAAVLAAVTGVTAAAAGGPLLAAAVASQVVKRRISKRTRAFEAQLPDALSLIASSLSAGHTFLRAIQMMCEESGPPLSEEFGRVVAETRLGDPVVDALDRMAQRLGIRDMDIVVQAIRIQQTVGGRLADLLHTLADFIRLRDELRREVRVLTAEGRMSAWVLAALVPFLFLVMRSLNPGYLDPLYSGWGLVVLGYCVASVVGGVALILRMVRIDI
ncbi:MAG: type II secretion system F family protein [Actinomycetota bacterium]